MTTDIEFRLRDHYAKLADEVQVPEMAFEDILADRAGRVHRATLDATQAGRARSSRSWVLAAASVVLLVAGLVALASLRVGNDTDDPSTPAGRTEQTPLSAVDDVLRSDWIIATTLPADRQWLYGLASREGVLSYAGGGGQFSRRVSW